MLQMDIDDDNITLICDSTCYDADNGYNQVQIKNISVMAWLGPIEIDITEVLKTKHVKFYNSLVEKLKTYATEKYANEESKPYYHAVVAGS